MTILTEDDIADAELAAQAQRMRLAKSLQFNEAIASPEDVALSKEVMAVSANDADRFDKALGTAAVNGLFRRGILSFEVKI